MPIKYEHDVTKYVYTCSALNVTTPTLAPVNYTCKDCF